MKKSIDANWPSGGVHFDLRVVSVSKASFSVLSEWSSLSGKMLSVERGEEFFDILFGCEFASFFGYRNEVKAFAI